MTYSDKLKDPRWQKLRLEIFNRDKFTCQSCGDTKSNLHVHHKNYIPGLEPWETPLKLLITLCEFCHEEETLFQKECIKSITDFLRENFLSVDIKHITIALKGFFRENDISNIPLLTQLAFQREKFIEFYNNEIKPKQNNEPLNFTDEIHNTSESNQSN